VVSSLEYTSCEAVELGAKNSYNLFVKEFGKEIEVEGKGDEFGIGD